MKIINLQLREDRACRRGAKWPHLQLIEQALVQGDQTNIASIAAASVHLVVTAPPPVNLPARLMRRRRLNNEAEYGRLIEMLDDTWIECFRVLVPGGRLCVISTDLTLTGRTAKRDSVVPFSNDILTGLQEVGFEFITSIAWQKPSVGRRTKRAAASAVPTSHQPNEPVTDDIAQVLVLRKPGNRRGVSRTHRLWSQISPEEHASWFRRVWTDIDGQLAAAADPYPLEVPRRLIRMFSFSEDVVLDPFAGSGTTLVAAMQAFRNGIGIEALADRLAFARRRLAPDCAAASCRLSLAEGFSLDQ